jgi:predicted ferric reductase
VAKPDPEGGGVVTQALWYLSRATGLVSLVMFTSTMVLGTLNSGRFATAGWPRFTISAVHRNLSLLSLAFTAVHVSTAIIDPYASIQWVDAIVPFVSSYQTFWLGLGAVALDLTLAVLVTSLLRTRIPHQVWQAVHWSAYACWPIAVVHGLGIGGADSLLGWVICVNVACVLAVAAAVVWRVSTTHPDTEVRKRRVEAG